MATLPNGYTQLEYIESTGTQYILTNIIPTNLTRLEAKVSTTQSSSCGMVVCDETWRSKGYGFWGNAIALGNQTNQDVNLYDGNIHTVLIDSQKIYIDGNLVLTYSGSSFSGVCPISIFALNRNGSIIEKTSMKLFELNIDENTFIPCISNNEEICLYNSFTKTKLLNNGTGSFIAGPKVVQPNMYVKINNIWQPVTGIYTKTNNIW